VPGWHQFTKDLQQEGKIQMIGIIEEQHPDRARLFMQWKNMQWPVMVDALDLLGVSVVPITLFIDEYGVIRFIRPKKEQLSEFIQTDYEAPEKAPPKAARIADFKRLEEKAMKGDNRAARRYADAAFLWGDLTDLDKAIDAYKRSLALDSTHAETHFKLGVAFRKRYDSKERRAGDFQQAVNQWQIALNLNPNHYIYRRRIQQFGPRLEKPYPFYDWVQRARQEIKKRGERPEPLIVEPSGAEFARPAKKFAVSDSHRKNPDPQGRILQDRSHLIKVESTVVPPVIQPGASFRTHFAFRPDKSQKAFWNNEADNLIVWIDPPSGWKIDSQFQTVRNPPQETSTETRTIEIEIKSPDGSPSGTVAIPGFALYYVCEGENGTCLFRRQDFRFQIQVKNRSKANGGEDHR